MQLDPINYVIVPTFIAIKLLPVYVYPGSLPIN